MICCLRRKQPVSIGTSILRFYRADEIVAAALANALEYEETAFDMGLAEIH